MKFHVLNRKVHYWLSIAVAVPVLLVIITGLMLQLKKEIPWIQPPEQRGRGQTPQVDFALILDKVRAVKESEVSSWQDIERIDVRPGRGMMKVLARNNWEIQLDAQTGEVLQVSFRRSDLIESLHDGSFFSPAIKYGVFLPAGVILLTLWLTGLYLFLLPWLARWRRRNQAAQESVKA